MIHFNAIQLSAELAPWLLDQAPLTVVMGVVIWWLSQRLTKSEKEKDEVSREVIKLATLWERKTEKSEEEDDILKHQILKSLEEIKTALTKK